MLTAPLTGPLPSARELAVELRVNPNTVQRAYRELERDGVVQARRGSGTFVSESALPSERRKLVDEMARRFVTEAYAAGVTPTELVRALQLQLDEPDDREREAG